jgi:Fic family protein
MFTSNRAGTFILCSTSPEPFKAFVPHPLPPHPPLELDKEHYDLMEKANQALGRLDGVTMLLPDITHFLYLYVRKEALLSSQIEGTQSSLSDLLLHEIDEAPGVPLDDVQEVSNYVAAMSHGLQRLREGFPLSLRLIREIHKVLLSKGRGSAKEPGEFRRSQNWIGGTRPSNAMFVPPPPDKVLACMGDLEKFLHDDPVRTPVLIKAALSHVQFETIHPFLDGNGRLGRLLITFLLCAESVLTEPMLYLSLYFKTHRQIYYDLLQQVRLEGDWESWLRFFLTGVWQTANQAATAAKQILELFENDKGKIEKLGRPASSVLRVHRFLQNKPIVSIQVAAKNLGLSVPTTTAALTHLQKLGIVREMTGRQRHRLFLYEKYLNILNEGTEPLER